MLPKLNTRRLGIRYFYNKEVFEITFGWLIGYTFIFEINFSPFGHFITMMN